MPLDKWLARAKANKQLCHCESCLLVVAGEYAAIEAETMQKAIELVGYYANYAVEDENQTALVILKELRSLAKKQQEGAA